MSALPPPNPQSAGTMVVLSVMKAGSMHFVTMGTFIISNVWQLIASIPNNPLQITFFSSYIPFFTNSIHNLPGGGLLF
jgi:hypothetical protein